MKLKEVLDKTIQFYKDKKIENARLEAEWLFSAVLKLERVQLYMKFDQPLKETELNQLREAIRRRVTGEPLAYIIGTKGFYGYEFKVTPDVLIPRPETETLVEQALLRLKSLNQDTIQLADLGCGSGCIGLTIAKNDERVKVDLVDISPEAIKVAQENASHLDVINQVQFIAMEAQEFLRRTETCYDAIVANPPYIHPQDPHLETNVRRFEPSKALFADEGTSVLKKWSELGSKKLSPNGFMLMEMGHDQGTTMKSHFEGLNIFSKINVIQDYSGHDRIISGDTRHG